MTQTIRLKIISIGRFNRRDLHINRKRVELNNGAVIEFESEADAQKMASLGICEFVTINIEPVASPPPGLKP